MTTKEYSTKEAFRELINTPDIHEKLGLSAVRIRTLQSALKKMDEGTVTNKEKISNDKMEELLERAGWKVVQEKKWSN
jgi:hypothetical protein